MLSDLVHGVRVLFWFPFAFVGNLATYAVLNFVVYVYWPSIFPNVLWCSTVLCGLAIPLKETLRPPPRTPRMKGPPRELPILPRLVVSLLKPRGKAPSLAQARRALPKELRALLAAPVTRPPEAVLHGQALAAQLAPPNGQKAA